MHEVLGDPCQPEWSALGDNLQGSPPAPGPKDDPCISGKSERVGGHPLDECSAWKVRMQLHELSIEIFSLWGMNQASPDPSTFHLWRLWVVSHAIFLPQG